jgi:hypothetical protein
MGFGDSLVASTLTNLNGHNASIVWCFCDMLVVGTLTLRNKNWTNVKHLEIFQSFTIGQNVNICVVSNINVV